MKIIVQESGEKPIKIVLPTGMIFNPVTAMIVSPLINKTLAGKLSEEDIDEAEELAESAAEHPVENRRIRTADMIRFMNEVNRMKRLHKGMPLVEVEDDGGDGVKIYL